MKAYVLHDIDDFRLEEVQKPEPGPGEVLVEVRAAGICGSDIPRIYKTGTYSYPLIPGHEFSGVVTGLGEGTDETWMGRRVGLFPLIPCRRCKPCLGEQYEMCRSYGYIGSRRDGGFAEYVRIPRWNLVALPDNVSFEQGAMLEPMAVAVHAMRRADPLPEDRVVICGLGTIGLFLLMFLKERGIENVLAIGNKDIQREKALALGVSEDCWFDTRTGDVNAWLSEREHEADLFFECVGRNEVLAQAVSHTACGGRVVTVGNPASDMTLERQTYWKILRNQLTVVGTWNSSYNGKPEDDWHYVMDRLADGRIQPERMITHRLDFDNMERGFRLMRDKTEEYVKVMGIL